MKKTAFTLVELLVVMSIIGVLSTTVSTAVFNVTKKTQSTTTGQVKSALVRAAQLYWVDMGFYPPDVGRGWDPGFQRKLPWNSDIENGEDVPSNFHSPGTDCSHCPHNWEELLDRFWNGPYLTAWPDETAWGGEYDYNYWPTGANRSGGCVVSPGIYAGAQGTYGGGNEITNEAEQLLIEVGLDDDGCINNESQLLLHPL